MALRPYPVSVLFEIFAVPWLVPSKQILKAILSGPISTDRKSVAAPGMVHAHAP